MVNGSDLGAIDMKAKSGPIAVHTERLTIALPSRLKRQAYDAAECLGVPASEFMRDAIERAAIHHYTSKLAA
jgi:hypothetical protein